MRASKKKTMLSKLAALCLAMILTLSMSVTAFAAITPDSTQDVAVSGLDAGTTVSIYKVIDVQVTDDGQPEEPMYTWTTAMQDWVAANYPAYIGDGKGNAGDVAVTAAFTEGSTAEAFRSFWHDVEAAIKNGNITITAAADDQTVANSQTSVTFSDMPMGEYLLSAKGGVKIYQPTTVLVIPEYDTTDGWTLDGAVVGTNSVMKGKAPDIEKDASTADDKDQTVAVGDVVDYTLTVDVPSYPEDAPYKTFIIGDTLGRGLTFNKNVKVYANSVAAGNEIDGQYYTYTDTGIAQTFTVTFNTDFFNQASVPEKVVVTYSAAVNEDAFETDALLNNAFLGYNNDPYTNGDYKIETDEEVYTYGINVTKIAKENPQKTLAGAQFELSQGGAKLAFDETTAGSGIYNYNPNGSNTTLTVNANGVLQLQGLDEGTYTLTEITAPDGYVVPTGTVTVVITDDVINATQASGEDGVIDAENVTTSGTISVPEDDIQIINDNVIAFKIENTNADDAGFNLPKTGGMGTMLFTIGGIVLMGGAVAVIIGMTRKKKA